MSNDKTIEKSYEIAKNIYAAIGVDTEAAINRLVKIPVSLHCWQGDDLGGFEWPGAELAGGGIQATGNYPGKARTIDELRSDLDKALTASRRPRRRGSPRSRSTWCSCRASTTTKS